MTSTVGAVLIVGLVLAVLVSALLHEFLGRRRRRRARRTQLEAYARRHGLTPVRASTDLVRTTHRYPLDGTGRVSDAWRLTRVEHVVTIFDWTRLPSRSSDRTRSFFEHTVLIAPLPVDHEAELFVTPVADVPFETRADHDAYGTVGLDVVSGDFNDRYRVRTSDPRFASDVLDPLWIAYLLDHATPSWRIEEGHIVMFSDGLMAPDRLHRSIGQMLWMLEHFPEHLRTRS